MRAIETHLAESVVETVWLAEDAIERGQREGLWRGPALPACKPNCGSFTPVPAHEDCGVTEKGARLFTNVDCGFWSGSARLASPVRRRMVRFIGIPVGKQNRVTASAEFLWEYFPSDGNIAAYLRSDPQAGTARFRLYDNGWRLADVDFPGSP